VRRFRPSAEEKPLIHHCPASKTYEGLATAEIDLKKVHEKTARKGLGDVILWHRHVVELTQRRVITL
jgi:hypothetical protein